MGRTLELLTPKGNAPLPELLTTTPREAVKNRKPTRGEVAHRTVRRLSLLFEELV